MFNTIKVSALCGLVVSSSAEVAMAADIKPGMDNTLTLGWDAIGLLSMIAIFLYAYKLLTRPGGVFDNGPLNRPSARLGEPSKTRQSAERAGFRVITGSKE